VVGLQQDAVQHRRLYLSALFAAVGPADRLRRQGAAPAHRRRPGHRARHRRRDRRGAGHAAVFSGSRRHRRRDHPPGPQPRRTGKGRRRAAQGQR